MPWSSFRNAATLSVVFLSSLSAAERLQPPDVIYGSLFEAVQRGGVFPDQKTFPDCVPRSAPEAILAAYADARVKTDFDLAAFVHRHFLVPETPRLEIARHETLKAHLDALWSQLKRAPDTAVAGSSLIPLPHPYIVPGGRFREIYYWDTYFTMLGLRESGEEALIAAMVDNFAHLIGRFGHIPNGNRTYYLSRSQPPYFSLMVALLAERGGDAVYARYLPALQAEHDYWMDRTGGAQHVVTLESGVVLNRYDDTEEKPRAEAFVHDESVAQRASGPAPATYRHLRAACASGWDFSSRWLEDGKSLEAIRTRDLVPVDLNCLLHHLESTLAKAYRLSGDTAAAERLQAAADRRRHALQTLFWSDETGFFHDYDHAARRVSPALTLAGVTPLFFQLATDAQARRTAEKIERDFLKPGGVVTTLVETGQQWDAPNGWAPLQWLTIRGLENYAQHELATTIARRWLRLNEAVFERTGRMMEKYDVVDTTLEAGGGEYPSQDGFGWTNGVYLKLARMYPER